MEHKQLKIFEDEVNLIFVGILKEFFTSFLDSDKSMIYTESLTQFIKVISRYQKTYQNLIKTTLEQFYGEISESEQKEWIHQLGTELGLKNYSLPVTQDSISHDLIKITDITAKKEFFILKLFRDTHNYLSDES